MGRMVLWAYGKGARTRRRVCVVVSVLLLLVAGGFGVVFAATRTMNQPHNQCPDNSNWSLTFCWQGGTVPVTGDDVIIDTAPPGGAAQTTYNLGASVQLHSITITSVGSTGNAMVSGGPIVLGCGGALPACPSTVTDNWNNTGNDLFPGVTLNGSTTFSLTAATEGLHFTGAITGTGPLTLSNTGLDDGLQLLSTSNSWTGGTTISGTSEVAAFGNGAIPTGSALTVNSVAELVCTASSTIGSLAGAGTVSMQSSGTLTVGGDNTSTTFSGVYQNSGGGNPALTKTGTGTLTLPGANTYTGATMVNAGTLAVTGSIVSPVTVNSGGTLAGTGTISNTVTVNSGGTLSPGTSPGIINTGSLTLTSGSTLTIELNGPTVGTQYDQVNVT